MTIPPIGPAAVPPAPEPSRPAEAASETRIPILELDGFHGHLLDRVDPTSPSSKVGGAARISAEIRDRRDEVGDVLLLSGGDFFQGPPISTVFAGEPVIRVMNHDRFDAMTLGNHDFDQGVPVLADRVSEAHFPILAANLMDERTGRHVSEGDHPLARVKPYAVKELHGARVAVIGMMKPDTPQWTHPDNVRGLQFEPPSRTLQRLVPEIMHLEKPDVVVLHYPLLHHAPDLAREIQQAAREATGQAPFVLVVGGHNYPEYASPRQDSGTMILEGTDRGAHVNSLDLRFDPRARRVVGFQHERVAITQDTPSDPHVQDLVDRYKERLGGFLDRQVVLATSPLTRERHVDSPLGNVVTDVMRQLTGADIAFLASGTLKSDLPAGVLSVGDLMGALPFDNRIVLYEMTGTQVRQALEESASRRGGNKILQMSGLRMIYDPEAPIGQRVLQAQFDDGSPLVDGDTYRVAADDFLQVGGDNYGVFGQAQASPPGAKVRDLVIEELSRQEEVAASGGQRVTLGTRAPEAMRAALA